MKNRENGPCRFRFGCKKTSNVPHAMAHGWITRYSPIDLCVIVSDLVVRLSASVFIDFRCHFWMDPTWRRVKQGAEGQIVEEMEQMKTRRTQSLTPDSYEAIQWTVSAASLSKTRTIGLCLLRYQPGGARRAEVVRLRRWRRWAIRSPLTYREENATLLVARFISYISSAWALVVMFVNQVADCEVPGSQDASPPNGQWGGQSKLNPPVPAAVSRGYVATSWTTRHTAV